MLGPFDVTKQPHLQELSNGANPDRTGDLLLAKQARGEELAHEGAIGSGFEGRRQLDQGRGPACITGDHRGLRHFRRSVPERDANS